MSRLCQALSSALLLALLASAQETTGTIAGTVRDAQGAVIPNASVTIHNTQTGADRRRNSSSEGQYVATALPVGTYELTVEKTGFKKVTAQGVRLSVDNRLVIDVVLEVGSVTESFTVMANVT